MQMSGLLKAFPPADLLQWAHNDRLTGTLVLRRSSREKRILLREGKIVGCVSNERFEFYGQFLLASGVVTEHQLLMALSYCEESVPPRRLGEALVDLEILDQQTVIDSLSTQTEQSILDLFLWPRGVFFLLEDKPERPKLEIPPIDPIRLVLEGARQMDEVARIRVRLPHDGVVLKPGPAWPGAELSHLAARIVGVFKPGGDLDTLHSATGGGYCRFITETDQLLQAEVFEIEELGEPEPETQTLSLLDLMLDRIHEDRQATVGVTVGMPLALFGQFFALWLGPATEKPDDSTALGKFAAKLNGRAHLSTVLSRDRQTRDEELEWLWLQIGSRRLTLLPKAIDKKTREQLTKAVRSS